MESFGNMDLSVNNKCNAIEWYRMHCIVYFIIYKVKNTKKGFEYQLY